MDLARNLIGRINVGDSLTPTAAARPGQLAVVDGERRLSYADFNAYVNRLAHGLARLGYERGAALALASGNSADFLAVYYACAKLGVAVPSGPGAPRTPPTGSPARPLTSACWSPSAGTATTWP